jgi:hypothetical protein
LPTRSAISLFSLSLSLSLFSASSPRQNFSIIRLVDRLFIVFHPLQLFLSLLPSLIYIFYTIFYVNIDVGDTNSIASVRKETIPTERSPLVSEVSANSLRWSASRILTVADRSGRVV